jgi:hypothetical protein
MLRSCSSRFRLVRVFDKEILLASFCSTWRSAPPLRNTSERCKDSLAIQQAFSSDGKYLIKTPFFRTVIAVATEELEKVRSRFQPIKSSCMVPPDTTHEFVEVLRAMVPVVTGTSSLGAPLAMDFSMADGPPASDNENYVHFWPQDTVEAHHLLMDKIVCFAMSDFGGTHDAFRLMITCAVRRYGFLLSTLPHDICRMYLVVKYIAVHIEVFRIHTSHRRSINWVVLSASFAYPRSLGLNVPSLELDAAPAHYASFTATPANLITDYESESLGPMYGLIRQELLNVATSTLPWAVQ